MFAMMEGKRYELVVSTRACVSGCGLNPEAVFDNATSRLRVLLSDVLNFYFFWGRS